tara:strand:- start:198 stop:506 length:309 start_codon:yes stop_codon:yes gene_type:complete
MTTYKYAYSDAEGWAGIARGLVDGLLSGEDLTHEDCESLLGFLYVTDVISEDMGSILTYLRQTTGIDDWVGATGIGVCATGVEFFDRPAAGRRIFRVPGHSR